MTELVTQPTRSRRTGRFVRHLAEMTLAMMVGMVAYGALVGGAAALAGQTTEDVRLGRPELFALGMAAAMCVPMVAWMRRRGHGGRSAVEMCAAMVAPAVVLVACYRLGAVSADAVCPLACGAMVPAMAAAMLYRLDEYTGGARRV